MQQEEIEEIQIESLHELLHKENTHDRTELRKNLEKLLVALNLMDVYHGPVVIDDLGVLNRRGNGDDDIPIKFKDCDDTGTLVYKMRRVTRKATVELQRTGQFDLNPDEVLDLIPDDNLMRPMLSGLIKDVVNSFDKYASSSIKISNLQRFKKDDI